MEEELEFDEFDKVDAMIKEQQLDNIRCSCCGDFIDEKEELCPECKNNNLLGDEYGY